MLVVNKAVYTCIHFCIYMKLIAINNEINSVRISKYVRRMGETELYASFFLIHGVNMKLITNDKMKISTKISKLWGSGWKTELTTSFF